MSSRLCQSHKMYLLALLGHFTDRNDRFPYSFIFCNWWNPCPFIQLNPEKGTPFGGEPTVLVIAGSTPSPLGGGTPPNQNSKIPVLLSELTSSRWCEYSAHEPDDPYRVTKTWWGCLEGSAPQALCTTLDPGTRNVSCPEWTGHYL